MRFNKKEKYLLEQVCREYIKTKELVSKAESIDKKSGANIQINKEFRDALSHLIRIFGDQLITGGKKKRKEGNTYYEINFDKARGHIYRAGYDAIDGIAISLRESINNTEKYSLSIQTQAVPHFAKKIANLDNYHERIVKYKNEKDIGEQSSITFSQCIKELDEIRDDAQEIEKSISIMEDFRLQKLKDRKFTWWQSLLVAAGTLILGFIFGVLQNNIYQLLLNCIQNK
jgi:hypothetical protein